MPRLSRKNDPDSVRARQQALGLPEVDLEPYAKAAEAATGLLSIPVSVAQLAVYKEFLKKFPNDALAPDIKKQIKSLEKSIAAGTTTPVSTSPTG